MRKILFPFDKVGHVLFNELGVDYAQGYGIGKPVPLDELKLIKPYPGRENES
ncbi:MAG: hypothetical protein Q7U66_09075 [Methylobacter sp.]|nr:hypothetical protein [Methylobacter sp.]